MKATTNETAFISLKTSFGQWYADVTEIALTGPIEVATDLHIGSTNQQSSLLEVSLLANRPNTILLGDIIDLANCKRSDVNVMYAEMRDLQSKLGSRYILGNHERASTIDQILIVTPTSSTIRTAFMHGDFISWGPDRATQYRTKPKGASLLKRTFLVNTIEAFERLIDRSSYKLLTRAAEVAAILCVDQVVMGHVHPRSTIDTFGIPRVTVLPRGIHRLEGI